MRLATLATVLTLSLSVCPTWAQSPSPVPAPAPESKPASSIAGKWTLTADVQSPENPSTVTVVLDGTKVSGTLAAASVFPIAGEYVDGKLSFSLNYHGQATIFFAGALKDDGSMAGTMNYGEGPIVWSATRLKG